MYKKTVLLIWLLINGLAFGQSVETVLEAPETWVTEIIPFPIDFAPGIQFTGFEDLRFSPGWSKSESDQFWTYMFVWYVDYEKPLTEDQLTESFNFYYDGLTDIDIRNEMDTLKTNQLNKSICLFVKTAAGFSGKMQIFDSFFTQDYITLNILVTESICTKTDKHIIQCNVSLKPFEHEVWGIFDEVKVSVPCE
jgi:hypothetical protein